MLLYWLFCLSFSQFIMFNVKYFVWSVGLAYGLQIGRCWVLWHGRCMHNLIGVARLERSKIETTRFIDYANGRGLNNCIHQPWIKNRHCLCFPRFTMFNVKYFVWSVGLAYGLQIGRCWALWHGWCMHNLIGVASLESSKIETTRFTNYVNGRGLNNCIHQPRIKNWHSLYQLLVYIWQMPMFSFVKIATLVCNIIFFVFTFNLHTIL